MPVGALKARALPPGVETVPDTGTLDTRTLESEDPPPPHADIAPASTHADSSWCHSYFLRLDGKKTLDELAIQMAFSVDRFRVINSSTRRNHPLLLLGGLFVASHRGKVCAHAPCHRGMRTFDLRAEPVRIAGSGCPPTRA
jgi:hypothetical protein